MGRLERINYFMKIAEVVAERSTCSRAKVGAVLVDEHNRIVATGYNGSLPGAPHCIDEGCLIINEHCRRTVHAEMNAVLHLEHNYTRLILVSTHQPCAECYKAMVLANVQTIFFKYPYEDPIRDSLIEDLRMLAPTMVHQL